MEQEPPVMKRKLQEIGGSLFISVPQEWAHQLNLVKGSEITIESGPNNQLSLLPAKTARLPKRTVALVYSSYLHREIIAEYLFGTELISIQNKGGFTKLQHDQIIEYTNNLMNVEIVEETATKITLQHFHTDDAPLKMLINRMYFLTHTMLVDLSTATTRQELEGILARDATVGKIYLNIIMHLRAYLTGRLLTKEYTLIDILDVRLLIKQIELIGDEIKGLAHRFIEGKKCKKDDLKFLADKYAEAFTAYTEKNVSVARTFWEAEKKDKQRLRYDENIVRIYMHIKDISDLVI